MKTFIKRFARDERGITAIEYGLIAGILALGLITTLGTVSTSLNGLFTAISTALTAAK